MLDWEKCLLVGFMLIMKTCTRMKLVSFVLCMTGVLVLVFAGCRKEEAKKPEIPASSPASYMNDTNFMGRLSADRRERQKLLSARTVIVGKMKAMIDAKKAELGSSDTKAVKAALDADPAWRELEKQMKAANAKVDEHRKKTLGAVRERITPARSGRETASPKEKPISK